MAFGQFFCTMTDYRRISTALLVAWIVVILILLLLPGGYISKKSVGFINIPHMDKLVHFVLFGVFCFLMYCCLRLSSRFGKINLAIVCLFSTVVFGFFGEILQFLTNLWLGRTFTWTDLLADGLGGAVALLFLGFAEKKRLFEKIETKK